MDTHKSWRRLPRRDARDRAMATYRSRRARRVALWLVIALALFALLGFFAAPSLIRSQIATRASTALGRQVTVGDVSLNPFTLRLTLERLHIAEADGRAAFVDINRVTANASWASLFRAAPILDELRIESPRIHLQRSAQQRFNFTDIIQRFAGQPSAPDSSPARFALSNIVVHDGQIDFDDRVLDAQHRVDHLELGIPFIASLPSDTDIFVQPLLAMNIDGSPLKVQGQTKPFASSRESTIAFRFDQLDLPRYIGFVPAPLPVKVLDGKLSGVMTVDFAMGEKQPTIRIKGRLAVDALKVTGKDGGALLAMGRADADLGVLDPVSSRYRLGAVTLKDAALRYARLPGGKSNFDALMGGDAKAEPKADANATPMDIRVDTLTLANATIEYADLAAPAPARLVLDNLTGTLRGLSTVKAPPAALDVAARMTGGNVATKGTFDLAASRYEGTVDIRNVSLAPLMPLTPPVLAADITGGTFTAEGTLKADWHDAATVRLEKAKARLDGFNLVPRGGRASPITWKSLSATIALVDVATSETKIDTLLLEGMSLDLRRLANGNLDITSVLPANASAAHPGGQSWRWSVGHLGVNDGKVTLRDASAPARRNGISMTANAFSVDGLSDDLSKPIALDLKGGLGAGTFAVSGKVRPAPLEADLKVETTRLDIAPLQSLVTVPLNVTVASGLLSLDGHARYTDRGKVAPRVAYNGRATLGRVRVQDKVTNDDFIRWNSLSATNMAIAMGEGVPRIAIGGLALDDFYARVIINATGRLNLQDVVANPEAPGAVSVTQAQANPTPRKADEPVPVPAAEGPEADIRIGQITLTKGRLNYTDNFIKPNYTADVTELTGKIGAFGTAGGAPPAPLTLQGQLDGNAPVNIDGTINPLAPVAFLDITAKADGIQLTNLSPYSGKYAGYPITRGRLNVDVHYTLDQRKLSADNHIFIDQLTFGDRIEGPGISHLPVKLAVALLRDSDGRIDVHVPVTGSLDDPHFSVGGLIWRAIGNLIVKAVTSPFRLLASAGGGREDLGYVEFAPGSAVLDPAAETKLGELVKVLTNKPSINLDIIGRIDTSKDETGLRKVMVDDLVHQEQLNDKGDDTTAPTQEQQDKYLERAYRHASFPKPKNMIGLTKSQPPEEMRTLMETNMPVDADALRHLAERRASAVRQWLQGKVDDKRVFVVAPKLDPKGIDDGGKTTRVDFGLH